MLWLAIKIDFLDYILTHRLCVKSVGPLKTGYFCLKVTLLSEKFGSQSFSWYLFKVICLSSFEKWKINVCRQIKANFPPIVVGISIESDTTTNKELPELTVNTLRATNKARRHNRNTRKKINYSGKFAYKKNRKKRKSGKFLLWHIRKSSRCYEAKFHPKPHQIL